MENKKIEVELAPVVKAVGTIEEQVKAIVIKDEKTNAEAIEFVGGLTTKKKEMEIMRKFFVEPLNHQVKAINAKFKPEATHIDEVIQIVKGKMGDYHAEEENKRVKEEARLQKIRDNADKKREEKGEEKIAEPVKQVVEVQQTKGTGQVKSTIKKVWKHKVVSINKLPENVMEAVLAEAYKKGLIDTVIRRFVTAGIREMEGVDIYSENQVSIKV